MKKEAAEQAKGSEKVNIAKKLKRKGLNDQLIADSTGLSLEEVKGLRVRKKHP
ncbi:MAG: hypothetical protein R8G66_07920 [Cytophagales bacterium]|nr:hypothetical protein [Cytophagales bacterium]